MAEDVRADVEDDAAADAACELPGTEPTMLPRAPPVGLEVVVEVVVGEMPEHGKTVTVVVQVTRLAWLEAVDEPRLAVPPADWGSAMSAGCAELAAG